MKVPHIGLPALAEGRFGPNEAPWWLHPLVEALQYREQFLGFPWKYNFFCKFGLDQNKKKRLAQFILVSLYYNNADYLDIDVKLLHTVV